MKANVDPRCYATTWKLTLLATNSEMCLKCNSERNMCCILSVAKGGRYYRGCILVALYSFAFFGQQLPWTVWRESCKIRHIYIYFYIYRYLNNIAMEETNWNQLKGIVHPKMKILSLITHPHVVPNPLDLRSSSEHKLRYFWCIPRSLWPSHRQQGSWHDQRTET